MANQGIVNHLENVRGVPSGFKNLHDSFYCARRLGDCGAELPVYEYTKGSGSSASWSSTSSSFAILIFIVLNPRLVSLALSYKPFHWRRLPTIVLFC
ncbi:unnamed protein product [Strongylus vulgaris]|uniref:Uncharacterized protein n=1 Tax=Strongylus vulgaris TaxID=40348 RepID=A0A3P7IY41_STRVU|nr:unnamed protein product [Strongylus vulgaris]